MLTRCPECATTFRVTPEQLKARSGRVRCGACGAVFDALATLAEEPARAAPPVAEEPRPPVVEEPEALVAEEFSAPVTEEFAAHGETAGEAAATSAGSPLEEESAESAAGAPAAEAPDTDAGPAQESVGIDREAQSAQSPETTGEPSAEAAGAPAAPLAASTDEPRRRRTWPWLAGACVAALVLVLQALLHFRTELAVLYPETRPALLAACDLFGCELGRPRKPELVGIESSDISVADSHLALSATLKNRAPFAQEYPHLELTLTDTADRALVRRVLPPSDYLPAGHPAPAGFGARAEIAINLSVALRDVKPAGYRLYLFYP